MSIAKRIALALGLLVFAASAVALRYVNTDHEVPESASVVYVSPTYVEPTPEPTPLVVPSTAPYDGSVRLSEVTDESQQVERGIPELATDEEIEMIARTIWGEAGGCSNMDHRAAVAWCILNRVDAWGQSIEEVVTAENQFHGYIYWGDCPQEHIDLARDVVYRWECEHYYGAEHVLGRVLPSDYLYFRAYQGHNRFRNAYAGWYNVWDFSLESPY